jgi:hypothetical protein
MSTLSHHPMPERLHWLEYMTAEVWASFAITSMWIAVAVSAVWGPDFVSTSSGGNSTTIPSGVIVGMFACIGSWLVAKHAFGRRS